MMLEVEMRNYNHWFWNSFIIRKLGAISSKINVWCWNKQYNRQD